MTSYNLFASSLDKKGISFSLTATCDSIGTLTNAIEFAGISFLISPYFTHCLIIAHIFFIVALEYFLACVSKKSEIL